MSRQNELNAYISRLRSRLRLHAWLTGSALLLFSALATTIILVLLLNHYAFPSAGIRAARLALFLALVTAGALGILIPLIRLTSDRVVRKAEAAYPDFEQRLTTFHERQRAADPFLELLAAETLQHTCDAPASAIAPRNRLFLFAGLGLGCLATLIWMVTARPGFLGYGAAALWTGGDRHSQPLYSISVSPGNVAVRRNSDQTVTAHILGLHPDKVQLFAHYRSAKDWEQVTMQPEEGTGGKGNYHLVLSALPENVEYYVKAGPLTSPHYTVRVVELPSVKRITVTYHYPAWTGIKTASQEQSGDIRAIEGTKAQIEIETNKPLANGRLALDDGKELALSPENGNVYAATITMDRDGAYHIAALDQGQTVRLSEDYFIATDKAEPPQVSITHPGGDYRASPIEEVSIGVQSADQFGLRDLRLHYSVNGGPEQQVNLLTATGAKNAEKSHTLALEQYKLVPGDLVSVYATARDGHAEARTNISFVQVDPFEREFSQSQQSGGGGGGGGGQNNQMDISRREKELIGATWNQQNSKSAAASDGHFLADAQSKLRDQVLALSARMQSRDLSETNDEFSSFEKDMQQAADAMSPAADKLKAMQWKNALPLEQKALQALLRAEATFRQIQVAFGQQGGSGGGGANSAGRDLASLFDLEMDTEKNQYETAQNTSPAQKEQKDIDDILAKLDALARRQEDLSQQQKDSQQSFQQRWQQEMLRREAEELQRQLEQLARNRQQSSPQQSAQGSASSTSQSASRDQTGSFSARSSGSTQNSGSQQDQRIQQALRQLRQANEAMRQSAERQNGPDSARRALESAKDTLRTAQQQMDSTRLGSLSQEADRISQEQRAQTERINRFAAQGQADLTSRDSMRARLQQRNQLAAERQQLSNDLSQLQKNLRDTARTMMPNQPKAAQKLRQALTEMDDADVDNRLQRTADWLRRGINPNSNGTESEITKSLERLGQQIHQAESTTDARNPSEGQSVSRTNNQTAALEQLQRLRRQLDRLNGSNDSLVHSQRSPDHHNETLSRSQAQIPHPNPLSNRSGQGNQAQQAGNNGEIPKGGGDTTNGTAWNNTNTGNNTYASGALFPAPTDASGNPQDTERFIQQQLHEFDQLRRAFKEDPGISKEIRDLTERMLSLDPKRFPGNPALVDQMKREMLSSIDRMELQLLTQGPSPEARSGRSTIIPTGYKDAVADYYRRLSQSH
ncbi:DUF4175 domain-containing protein [Edaphobacter sp. 12200R-103]|uniref:DUF4175 domain-containing protein n=1 Tax=Edaphobacter sp. 12200R-103 TaxID=2703788 RepID=UPI00138CB194|nr:DUF4175 domain-containing protein [Edaphobacter sp. 12200R-103]QHS50685.1 DUF4175 domain-containing protein [Edaphobacter sp. 12200R-103]